MQEDRGPVQEHGLSRPPSELPRLSVNNGPRTDPPQGFTTSSGLQCTSTRLSVVSNDRFELRSLRINAVITTMGKMTLPPICDDPMLLDDNIGNILLIPAAILMVPSVITTGLRIFARKNALGRDDWTILIGACLVVILNTLSIIGIQHGKGRHVCFLEDDQISIIGKYSWINQIVLFWALFFIKASVCLLVLRVKSTAVLRWVSGVTIGLMFISTVVACAALMAECKPVSAYWNRSSGQCRAPTFRIYSIWVQACMCSCARLLWYL